MALISTKLRQSAKDQPCAFGIPGVCNYDPTTTVFAHAPSQWKGAGNKSPDYLGAFACSSCHEAMDQRNLPESETSYYWFYWFRAMQRTWANWVMRGLVILPVDPETAETRPRKKSKIKNGPMAGTKASGIRKRFDGKFERRFAQEAE